MLFQLGRRLGEEEPADAARVDFRRRIDRFDQHRHGRLLPVLCHGGKRLGADGIGNPAAAENVVGDVGRPRHLENLRRAQRAQQIADIGGIAAGDARALANAFPPLRTKLAESFADHVVEIIVDLQLRCGERDFGRPHIGEETRRADGLQPDARILIGGKTLQFAQRIRHPVAPVAENADGRGAGTGIR
jgi:hypothetical protein